MSSLVYFPVKVDMYLKLRFQLITCLYFIPVCPTSVSFLLLPPCPENQQVRC